MRYILKIYCWVVLWADAPLSGDRFNYYVKAIFSLSVVAWLLDAAGFWFAENRLFFTGLLIAVALNMWYGFKSHKKAGNFKWKTFWVKNFAMWGILISVYPLLEVLYRMAGENAVAEIFKLTVQVSTILYPGGKALKNAYIYSNKEYPPAFIMERLFDFEKDGDIKKLFGDTTGSDTEVYNENDNNKL